MSKFGKIAMLVLSLVLVLGIAGCGGSTPTADVSTLEKPSDSASQDSDSASEDSGSSFKDGTLTTPEMKIVVTKYEVIPAGKKGNEYGDKPVIAFWYKVTNVAAEKLDPSTAWIFGMNAFQDNNPNAENELEVGMLPDDRFGDTQMENIKKGGTVESAVAYELDDLKTPVDLVASEGLGTTEIGRTQYEIKK